MCESVCASVCETALSSVCVCVCLRETALSCVCVFVCVSERDCIKLCVCVCVRTAGAGGGLSSTHSQHPHAGLHAGEV